MIGSGGAFWSLVVPAGRHRAGRHRARRGVAALLVPVLVVSSLAVATIVTNLTTSASAVDLPQGGLVPSATDSGLTQGEFAVPMTVRPPTT